MHACRHLVVNYKILVFPIKFLCFRSHRTSAGTRKIGEKIEHMKSSTVAEIRLSIQELCRCQARTRLTQETSSTRLFFA